MLIGGYDINNDVITLGPFSCFFLTFFFDSLVEGSHREIGVGIQIPET